MSVKLNFQKDSVKVTVQDDSFGGWDIDPVSTVITKKEAIKLANEIKKHFKEEKK